MTRNIGATIRLVGAALALAAAIAGLGSTGTAPAHPVLLVATTIAPAGH